MAEDGKSEPLRVLIVCTGNTCRSPMGQAVMQNEAKKKGLAIFTDSAGTAAHGGGEPNARTVSTCKKHEVPINHVSRAVVGDDFNSFDWILASDQTNLAKLNHMAPKSSKAKITLFGSFDDNEPIQDPYWGGIDDYETTYEQCVRYSNAFFRSVFSASS